MTEGSTHLSPDGRWTWDGQQWVPTNPEQAVGSPPSGSPSPAAPARTDGKAIGSLVLGLLWLGGLGSIGAVILGHLSRSEAKREGRQPSGLALAGLILGYVGAALIFVGILAAIAIPVFLNQRQVGYDTQIKSDLRKVALLEEAYNLDHETYADNSSQLSFRPSGEVRIVILSANADHYCLKGGHPRTDHLWFYDSDSGLSINPCS